MQQLAALCSCCITLLTFIFASVSLEPSSDAWKAAQLQKQLLHLTSMR
jgi:hypothetical protein